MALTDVWSMPQIRGVAAIEASHPPRGVMVPVPGGRLHLIDRRPAGRESGRLPAVLVHGASGNACDMTLELFASLARERRVIAVDRLGHGWSGRPGGLSDADPARQAQLILSGLRRIGALPASSLRIPGREGSRSPPRWIIPMMSLAWFSSGQQRIPGPAAGSPGITRLVRIHASASTSAPLRRQAASCWIPASPVPSGRSPRPRISRSERRCPFFSGRRNFAPTPRTWRGSMPS